MNADEIWVILSSITIGTVVEWCIILGCIISAVCAGAIKLYKVFQKYTDVKEDNEKLKSLVEKHDKRLDNMESSLHNIEAMLNEQKDVNFRQLKYDITHICDYAIRNKCISPAKLKNLEELYEEYVQIFHGNGYIKTMVEKVELLDMRDE